MIVLFTDFGVTGPYMGQMEAVLHRRSPGVPVVTLFADAPAFRPQASAYLLAAYAPEFPSPTVFLCVVDPGVGGERACGFLEADGRWFVGPDNGLLAIVARRAVHSCRWFELTDPAPSASATFHGRDIFAPAAAGLANGERPPSVERETATVLRPEWPDDLAEVIYIDGFGNAMTGIRAERAATGDVLIVGRNRLKRARTFSDVPTGEAFWYENANGLIELAVNGGRACDVLGVAIGDPIVISEV